MGEGSCGLLSSLSCCPERVEEGSGLGPAQLQWPKVVAVRLTAVGSQRAPSVEVRDTVGVAPASRVTTRCRAGAVAAVIVGAGVTPREQTSNQNKTALRRTPLDGAEGRN